MATYSLGQEKANTVQNRSAKRQLHVMRRYRFWGFAISFLRKRYKTSNAKSPKTYFMTREFSLLLIYILHVPPPVDAGLLECEFLGHWTNAASSVAA